MSSTYAARLAPRVPSALPPLQSLHARDGLSKAQLRGVVVAIALAHVGAIWGILQVPAVREAVVEAAPMFVDLLAPPPPQVPPPPPPKPIVKAPPPPVIAAPPKPADPPAPFVVEPPPPEPAPAPVQQVVEPPPAPPAPAPAPVVIPASAVQFLEAPQPPEYPRASKRLSEAGTVMLRVYIDERGLPATVQVSRSSNFPRLDEAALTAVRKWRFKPYTVNGRPTAGWATIPVMFELEK